MSRTRSLFDESLCGLFGKSSYGLFCKTRCRLFGASLCGCSAILLAGCQAFFGFLRELRFLHPIQFLLSAEPSLPKKMNSSVESFSVDPMSTVPASPKLDAHNVESCTGDDLDDQALKKPDCCDLNDHDPLASAPSATIEISSLKMDSHNIESCIDENLDDRPFKKAKCSESSDFDQPDKKVNGNTDLFDDDKKPDQHELVKVGDKKPDQHELVNVGLTYDYLPQDYTLTDYDFCAQIAVDDSLPTDILVKIDDVFIKQEQLLCLLDPKAYINDDVISAYICCLKDQTYLRSKNGFQLYFENPFISGLLKRDGNLGVVHDGNFLTDIVRSYLKHDMILVPINIDKTHWYLAVINAQRKEIQVLDSLCWDFNRDDLTKTLRGVQYHLNIIGMQQNMFSHDWTDLHVTEWIVTEQLHDPVQKDSSSCGLFMLKFMEYWDGVRLSHQISQEDISGFRYKLISILLCWNRNTAGNDHSGASNSTQGNSDDVKILGSPDGEKRTKELCSIPDNNNYESLMSVVSKMSAHDLVSGLCSYIKSIKGAEALDKVWVRNSKPYSISLSLKKLQEILKENQPMELNCLNLAVRKFMLDNYETSKKSKRTISKHYLDMQFWEITDYGRHPNFRKNFIEDRLAECINSWPGINYSVSRCKSILMPIEFNSGFILLILNKDNRTVYILDPTPLDPIYEYNPDGRYVKKILWVAEYLPKAMAKACPGSRWNEDIFLWRQIILPVPIYNRELSGYLVCLFMTAWKDEGMHLPVVKDGYELRKQMVAQLLTYKDNECEDNIPAGVRDFLKCINTAV